MELFTIGYGGREPRDLVAILVRNDIQTVVDVRLRPDRAYSGAFVKARSADRGIEKTFSDATITYRSLPELGNIFLEHEDWESPYKRLLQLAGELLTRRLLELPTPICLLCAERDPARCHRALIAEYLSQQGWQVTHIE